MAQKKRGPAMLAAALRERDESQETLADAVGVSRQSVSLWLAGTTAPIDAHKRVLRDKYGIPADAWLD